MHQITEFCHERKQMPSQKHMIIFQTKWQSNCLKVGIIPDDHVTFGGAATEVALLY